MLKKANLRNLFYEKYRLTSVFKNYCEIVENVPSCRRPTCSIKKKNIENIKEVMLEICQISSSKDSSRRLLSSLV